MLNQCDIYIGLSLSLQSSIIAISYMPIRLYLASKESLYSLISYLRTLCIKLSRKNSFIRKHLLQASMSCSCNFSTSDIRASNCLASSREGRHFIPLKGLIQWKSGNYSMSCFVEDKLDCLQVQD